MRGCLPHRGPQVLEEAEAQELINGGRAVSIPKRQKPRVYYLNLPKKFIGGTVYDPVAKEVVIGATCTLTAGGSTWTAATDGFGDFWFEDLDVGTYDLEILADGSPPKRYSAIGTEKDVNLGDIPVSPV